MIFALFGTGPYPFTRLGNWLDRLASETGHDIIAQIGSTQALTQCRSFDYTSHAEIRANMEAADCIIAHSGYGTCLDALYLGRPLIIVPRRPDLGEIHADQQELAHYLATYSEAVIVDSYEALRDAVAVLKTSTKRQGSAPETFGTAVGTAISTFLEKKKT